MQAVLLVIQLLVSIAMIGVILLQRSDGGALGLGGGGSGFGGLFSPRGAANTLTRTTAILATVFFCASMLLTILALRSHPESNVVPGVPTQSSTVLPPQKSPPRPANPQVPAVPLPH